MLQAGPVLTVFFISISGFGATQALVDCTIPMAFVAIERPTQPKRSQTPESDFTADDPDFESKFVHFIKINEPSLRRMLRARLSNKEDIDDAFQNGTLKAFKNWSLFDHLSKRESWLMTVYSNEVNRRLRKIITGKRYVISESDRPLIKDDRDREEGISILEQAEGEVGARLFKIRGAEVSLITPQSLEILFLAVDHLSKKDEREVVQLRYFGKTGVSTKTLFNPDEFGMMPLQDIAEAIRKTLPATRSLLYRAIPKVQKYMKLHGG